MWVFQLILYSRKLPNGVVARRGDRDEILGFMGSQDFIEDCRKNGYTEWEMRNVQVSSVTR